MLEKGPKRGNVGTIAARTQEPPSPPIACLLTPGLSAMSFDLHRKLAEQFSGSQHWGYRSVDTLVSIPSSSARGSCSLLPWLPPPGRLLPPTDRALSLMP